jgi:3-phosphoshikimate 1-carboxyvinyltransferase
MGAEIQEEILEGGVKSITLTGCPELAASDVIVPGDPSSAAFLVVAALITPKSKLTVENVCINPLRIGLYDTLREMGGKIEFRNTRTLGGEQVADLYVETSALKGINVPADRAPSMIDEYPILSIAAAFAEGETFMEGLAELRVKESDRLSAVAEGLERCGVKFTLGEDFLNVQGCAGKVPGGGSIDTRMDHRIIMSFLVMGAASQKPVAVDDVAMANTSFPGFVTLMNRLGAKIQDK